MYLFYFPTEFGAYLKILFKKEKRAEALGGYYTLAPKGVSDNLANLKLCFPNGIPMIVI